MYQSLLYRTMRETPKYDEKLIGDLMLDRVFTSVYADSLKRKFFLSVISEPLTDVDEINYRSDILRDFLANKNLLDGVIKAFAKFNQLRDDQQRERTKSFTIARHNDSDAAFSSARSIAQINATSAKSSLLFLREVSDLLHIYSPRSEGLKTLSSRIAGLTRGEAFDELVGICTKIEGLGDTDVYDVTLTLDESARIQYCRLYSVAVPPVVEEPIGIMKLFAPKQKVEPEDGIRINDSFGHTRNALLSNALSGLYEAMSQLSSIIFDEFSHIPRELGFYECAVAFCNAMKEKNVPLCWAQFGGETHVNGLYDLLLCSTYPNITSIVPNDFSFSDGGIIITGDNNTGKTVYLRSAGCAQLLAQCGLPVAAHDAVMRIRSGICTQYAAAEKEFTAGNDAGRFEQEVRAVAAMLEALKPDSLVLCNEIFQTTSYAEGAEGLYHILRYFETRGIGYVLVSHLRDLIPRLSGEAVHMETREGYKLAVVQ